MILSPLIKQVVKGEKLPLKNYNSKNAITIQFLAKLLTFQSEYPMEQK
jgi:hypothetical protein